MKHLKIVFFLFTLVTLLSSCGTQRVGGSKLYNPKEVDMLSKKLSIHLDNRNKDDHKNMPLYAESSLWLGVKYKYGGTTKRGIDCSGFTQTIFKKVYRKKIPRSTAELSKARQKNIGKGNLKTGDLVYFATTKNKKKITHVGIYLKENKFIHASTSRGVIVSSLNEKYYKTRWKKSGRM